MKVIDVNRMERDVIVTFEDGMVVWFSNELLREMVPRAEVFSPGNDSESDEGELGSTVFRLE